MKKTVFWILIFFTIISLFGVSINANTNIIISVAQSLVSSNNSNILVKEIKVDQDDLNPVDLTTFNPVDGIEAIKNGQSVPLTFKVKLSSNDSWVDYVSQNGFDNDSGAPFLPNSIISNEKGFFYMEVTANDGSEIAIQVILFVFDKPLGITGYA